MVTRKLISFGKNSFIVSLPKNWIQRNNLQKGDDINIEETFDMLILSTTNDLSKEETRIKQLFLSKDKDISRNLISAYINNYDIIEIKGDNLIDNFDIIRDSTQKITALEIMELGPKKVIIKNFLNTSDISLDNVLRRIDMIIRAMINEINESVINKNPINLDSRDEDINRLFYIATKLLNKLLRKPKLSKELNIPLKDALFKWRILVSYEQIGDQLKRLIRLFSKLSSEKEKKMILNVFNMISKEYLLIVKSLYLFDKEIAHNLLNKKVKLLEECENLLKMFKKDCQNLDHIINIVFVVDKLKRLISNISNIAKAIITTE